jgi:hypothetical protein
MHFCLDGMNLSGHALNAVHEGIFYLRLALP